MLQLRVDEIKRETANTTTFFLSDIAGKIISYQPGQFITLVFNHHGDEIRRSYSLSSSPDEKQLAITIKRIANGEISRFMLSKVKKGDVLNIVPPAGKFTPGRVDVTPNTVVYFAAGSGIVPVYSQLKYLLARPGKGKLILFYSNTSIQEVLFNKEIDALQTAHPNRFEILHLLSNEGNRLTNDKLEQLLKQYLPGGFKGILYFICGPFAYMRMVRLTLLFMGIEPGNIRKENFVLDTVPVADNATAYPPRIVKLELNGECYDINVGENQSILQAALQNNIALPYSCRGGVCSACTAKCLSGQVEMSVNDVLLAHDLSEGLVLTCTGHPVSDDVVLKI